MKKRGVVAAFAVAALALSACGGGSSDDPSSNSSSGGATEVKAADYLHAEYSELQDGGTLTLPLVEVSAQQNPFHQDGTGYTTRLWYWYNPQLALFDDDGEWYFNPDYFDDVTEEEVDGNTVITFKIKDEAVFNDGTPIDVNAFRVTWEANNGQNEEYAPNSTDGYERITSIEAGESDKEVVVTFDGIYAWWQGLFNDILHPSIDSPDEFANHYLNNMDGDLGAGPYKLESADFQSGTVTFVPNEKWWGDPGKLERITYRAMEDQASLNAFQNGEIDATTAATAERYSAVQGMSGIEIYTSMMPYNRLMMLNSGSEILADDAVRHAIMQGVNREAIANIMFQGIDYSEPLPGSFTLFSSQPGYNDNFSEAVTYDVDAANALLDEAGWVKGSDGIREKDGQRLTINYPVLGDNTTIKSMAQSIQQDMQEIGVELQISERPSSEFSEIYTNKDFDLFTMAFSSTDPFGVAYFGQIYGSDSGLNLSGTGTEEMDQKIAELQNISDPEEQIAAANELEVEAFQLYGIMPLYNGPDIYAVKEGLANFGSMGFAVVPKQNIGYVK
ncbi:MAG: ABC transporter family substrate-binding protein [Actinomycetaceae bacterium]|jgi:peptide/nickel transport system substrate-binding protein|nr:ABC transporter family substrate-binding protein [Actinomycetaceae bacterium]